MRSSWLVRSVAVILLISLLTCPASPAKDKNDAPPAKQENKAPAKDDHPAQEDEIKLPPFPPDKTVRQSMQLGGRTLNYDATVGSLPVLDEKGKTVANVMFIAYAVPGAARPVTFALNGGPGASSVFLNLGAIGPKRVQFGAEGDSPSDAAIAKDNPGTWLDFTDLVFIDPVGTGFSYSLVKQEEAKKRFYNPKADVEYLSRVIFDWLNKNGRMTSRKYLVGESYGGFRAPRITVLPADAAWRRHERCGTGLSLPRSRGLNRPQPIAAALDAHTTDHRRRESRA